MFLIIYSFSTGGRHTDILRFDCNSVGSIYIYFVYRVGIGGLEVTSREYRYSKGGEQRAQDDTTEK